MVRISTLVSVADSFEMLPVERIDFIQLCVCLKILKSLPSFATFQVNRRVDLPLELT